MGKVTITFEDDEADDTVVLTTNFDPPVEDEDDATAAQRAGAELIAMWHEHGPEPIEEYDLPVKGNN